MKRTDEIELHNGRFRYFENQPSKYFQLKTVKSVNCEDWKTNIVRPKPDISSGTLIDNFEIMTNCYGIWISTRHNGHHYYINPRSCEGVPYADH